MAVLNVNEVQPNSDKRSEFLIVLDYLLHHTSDEKHATSQSKIIEYAKKEYDTDIRRDRIPQILLHLKQLTEKYPDKFPFKLKAVASKSAKDENDGAGMKFYITERAFSDKEIVKIVSAIQSDTSLSNVATNELVDKFLRENASDAKKEVLLRKIEKRQRKTTKYTPKGMEFLENLEEYASNNERVWFKIIDKRDVDFDHYDGKCFREFRQAEELVGYIHSIKEVNNKFVVVAYLPDYKCAFITDATNFQIVRHMDLNDISTPCDFELNNEQYSSVSDWVEKHYKGQDGQLMDFVFKFTLDDHLSKETQYIMSSFRKHWKKPLEFEVRDREVPFTYINRETGDEVNEVIIVKDAYAKIRTNIDSFIHWYSDFKILSQVVIISPAYLNDRILAPLVARLAKRITKYGARYNFEVNRSYKPEYEEHMKELRARMKEKREARRAEAKVENEVN